MTKEVQTDWFATFSTDQLWLYLTRVRANIRAYRERIRDGGISLERLDAYAREISYWSEEGETLAEELKRRGLDPGWER